MRAYWDERGRINPMWYVDTSLDFDEPDLERFLETGRGVVEDALGRSPVEPAGSSVAVEIGAGLGRICLGLAEHFDRVVGVDISPVMLERARELVRDPRVSFIVGDGRGLSQLRDGVADLVFTFTVFQHIPDIDLIERYIDEAGRVLRPGGLFVFQWNNIPGARRWRIQRRWRSLLRGMRISGDRYGRDAPEFLGSRVPLERIERALEHGGLRLLHTEGTGTLFAWGWARRDEA